MAHSARHELLLLLLAVAGAGLVAAAVPSMEEVRKMKVRDLRRLLDERGVDCDGCVEKFHLVARVEETLHLPVIEQERSRKGAGMKPQMPSKDGSKQQGKGRKTGKRPAGMKGKAFEDFKAGMSGDDILLGSGPKKGPPADGGDPDVARSPDGTEIKKEDFLRQMRTAMAQQDAGGMGDDMAERLWADWREKIVSGEIKAPGAGGYPSIFGEGIMYWLGITTMPLFVLLKFLETRQKNRERSAAAAACGGDAHCKPCKPEKEKKEE